ncbi:hypothetical protein OX284_009425 [Flavobacterium sp. SUN046]|uniref:hypothetical protein n=1 Tax=Flavobacterium sp. SUN046 TaxID=3002440 RepID=UPI002DB963AF|nr:hypothetical protein [Flavobacterium sp. SUN046]MEC4049647.1 hypothetical protein [Flavobacterium sp. SUN046]
MLELLWGILNIGILIYFIIICFKAIKIVRDNLGGIATLVFVIGLMSFISKPNEENNKVKTFKIKDESIIKGVEKSNRNVFSQDIVLEKELASTIRATITFKEYDQKIRLLNAYADRSGFVSGIDWKASNVDITKNTDNSFNYQITGTKDWRILGLRVYTQFKIFKGKFKL